MFDGLSYGFNPIIKYLIAGTLILLMFGIVYFIFIKDSGNNKVIGGISNGNLKGELVYDYGRKILKRSIKLDNVEEMEVSIGPETICENHMRIKEGSSFKFTVSAVKSRDGARIVNIKCHPPGVLVDKGKVGTEANLYSGEEIFMNNIPIKYVNGQRLTDGENKLKGRM